MNEREELMTAFGLLKNQSSGLDLQRQIAHTSNQIAESNNQLLLAQREAEKNAIVGKLTDLLMEGVTSDYADSIFIKKVKLFLNVPASVSHAAELLNVIGDNAPSLLPVWADSFNELPLDLDKNPHYNLPLHPVDLIQRVYVLGWKKIKPNERLAFEWAFKGAQMGSARCAQYLGRALVEGLGCEQSFSEGERWSSVAAEAGNPLGVVDCARLHAEGLGRPKNIKKAREVLEHGLRQFPGDPHISLSIAQLDGAFTAVESQQRMQYYANALTGEPARFSEYSISSITDWPKYLEFATSYLGKLCGRGSDSGRLYKEISQFEKFSSLCKDSKIRDEMLAILERFRDRQKANEKYALRREVLILLGICLLMALATWFAL